jgi:hypothetical protein
MHSVPDDDFERHALRRFLSDHPGTPLGHGYPLGRTLREDGESHREAWMRILRSDPCGFCGESPAGTLDHIEPRAFPARGLGGLHSHLNYSAACEACNSRKAARSLLTFLRVRITSAPRPR